MDWLAKNLSWIPIFNFLDHASRVWNEQSGSVLTLSAAAVFYAWAGTRTDLLYNAALLVWLHRQSLVSHIQKIAEYMPLTFFCIGATPPALLAFASRTSYESTWQGPGRPYLIPCKTSHRRPFPKPHSFTYSYLTVGIPVGFRGSVNGMIGVEENPVCVFGSLLPFGHLWLRSWYYIQVSDHLYGGHGGLGLRGKLNIYLQSEVQPRLSSK